MSATKSDFQAAEEIKGILQGKNSSEVERIFRWVGESLGLKDSSESKTHTALPTNPQPENANNLTPLVQRPKDIRSFVESKSPKTDIHLAATIAYFYLFVETDENRKETITPKELNDACRLARGCGLKDAADTLNNALKQGYFDRVSRGSFKLNSVGENLVAMILPGSKDGARNVVRAKTRPSKKSLKRAKAK